MSRFYLMITFCICLVSLNPPVHAEPVEVGYDPNGSWTIIDEGSDEYYAVLESKGMKGSEQDDLVTDWLDYVGTDRSLLGLNVIATCGSPRAIKSTWTRMTSNKKDIPSSGFLKCEKGQSVSVKVLWPKGFTYIGELTRIGDDDIRDGFVFVQTPEDVSDGVLEVDEPLLEESQNDTTSCGCGCFSFCSSWFS